MLAYILLILVQQILAEARDWIWIIAFLVATMVLFLVLYLLLTDEPENRDVTYDNRLIDVFPFSNKPQKFGGMAEIYICDHPRHPGRKDKYKAR